MVELWEFSLDLKLVVKLVEWKADYLESVMACNWVASKVGKTAERLADRLAVLMVVQLVVMSVVLLEHMMAVPMVDNLVHLMAVH